MASITTIVTVAAIAAALSFCWEKYSCTMHTAITLLKEHTSVEGSLTGPIRKNIQ